METSEALNNSGIALTEANRPYEAIPLFMDALFLDPGNALLWLNLGIAQQHTGDYRAALDSFQKAIVFDRQIAAPWEAMGLIFWELSEISLAEDCYQAALMRENRLPKTWNNLGVLYFNEGNHEEARFCFEQALSISPLSYDALFNLRDTCRELRDYRAAAEFEKALSDLPNPDTFWGSRRPAADEGRP
jgi:tetratricopeptide (TPR) repeat protein